MNTSNGWHRSDKMNRLLVVEQHGHEPLGLVVPHKDDDLVLGDGLLIVGCQHHPLEVEQNDGSLLLESLVEHKDRGG